MTVTLKKQHYGKTAQGELVDCYTFESKNGVETSIINYGAIITSFLVPDNKGRVADIVLGYDSLAEYEACKKYFGCVVGRYANRIASGKFTLGGIEYQLEANQNGNHIHGGGNGFNKKLWRAKVVDDDNPQLILNYHSKDGEGNYPGNLNCTVTYKLSETGALEIIYRASTDKDTIVNLTNHSYFNLAGHQCATENGIVDHHLTLHCEKYLPTNSNGIPLSDPISVSDTPMDFTKAKRIGEDIDLPDTQLQNAGGYDHNWVIGTASGKRLQNAALLLDPASGRAMEVFTTQPGLQCYTANSVDQITGKGGAVYAHRGSICLETQHFPDSPNWRSFPSTVVSPNQPLEEVTVFRPVLTLS